MINISKEDINSLKNLSGKKFMITGGNGMLGDAFLDQLNKNISALWEHLNKLKDRNNG